MNLTLSFHHQCGYTQRKFPYCRGNYVSPYDPLPSYNSLQNNELDIVISSPVWIHATYIPISLVL